MIAQVSVTLGGFAGVVKVFAPGREFEFRDLLGLWLTIEHTFAAVFAALLPLVFWYSGVRQPGVWRVASILVAVFLAYEIVSQRIKIVRQTKTGFPPRHPWALRLHFFPGTIVALVVMIANVWCWQSEVAYIWVLIWLLNPPCVQLYLACFDPERKMHGTQR